MTVDRLGRTAAVLLWITTATSGFGCALLSRGASVETRWYTPELSAASPGSAGPGSAEHQAAGELRLGRVTSGSDLGLRIAYSDGLYQTGYYEDLRWTERPQHYVRRAVVRALFEEGPFRRTLTGAAPTLDIEVVAFEEVKAPTTHAARVSLHVVLSADSVLLERTVSVSKAIAGSTFDGFVAAMSQALDASAREVERDVVAACAGSSQACSAR
jgi:cholesterol transport system auxiliary component